MPARKVGTPTDRVLRSRECARSLLTKIAKSLNADANNEARKRTAKLFDFSSLPMELRWSIYDLYLVQANRSMKTTSTRMWNPDELDIYFRPVRGRMSATIPLLATGLRHDAHWYYMSKKLAIDLDTIV